MTAASRSAPPPPSFITAEETRDRKAEQKPSRAYRDESSPIDVDRVDRNINESLRKQIVEIIEKHPDLALSVLRGWKDRRD